MRIAIKHILFICVSIAAPALMQTGAHGQNATGGAEKPGETRTADPLLRLLVDKGLLTKNEAEKVVNSGSPSAERDRLAALLKNKGLISMEEFDALQKSSVVSPGPEGNAVETN